jgi:hypothetical protein
LLNRVITEIHHNPVQRAGRFHAIFKLIQVIIGLP